MQQIEGLARVTDDDIRRIFGDGVSDDTPCPLDLLIVMARMTNLRAAIACYGLGFNHEATMQDLLNATLEFDANPWAERIFLDEPDLGVLCARMFQVALRLHGIPSLPRRAIVRWARSSSLALDAYPDVAPVGCNAYETLRTLHRDELMGLVRLARENWQLVMPLYWPSMVAGVAVVDEEAKDQEFVARRLLDIWRQPGTSCSFIMILDKLRKFWILDKTGWDDCFYEPIAGTT